jgi:prepilin-type N-terminal cleavage/methylation domain-containing protein
MQTYWNSQNHKKGFSLIELLVVITIMVTLMAVLIPNLVDARRKAEDSRRKSELTNIKSGLRLYYNNNSAYPTPISVGNSLDGVGLTDVIPGIMGVNFPYIYGTLPNNGFSLKVALDVGKTDENNLSQLKCGISAGETNPAYYMICGN